MAAIRATQVEEITAQLPFRHIALFGSVARGDASEGSAINLLVVTSLGRSAQQDSHDLLLTQQFAYLGAVGISSISWEDLRRPNGRIWCFVKTIESELRYLRDPADQLKVAIKALPDVATWQLRQTAGSLLDELPELQEAAVRPAWASGQAWGCAKAAAMYDNACASVFLSDRLQAMAACAERHSDLAEDFAILQEVYPAYLATASASYECSLSDITQQQAQRALASASRIIARCAAARAKPYTAVVKPT